MTVAMATLLCNFLTVTALLTVYILPITRGGVLAVSKLQSCVNDGSVSAKEAVVAVPLPDQIPNLTS